MSPSQKYRLMGHHLIRSCFLVSSKTTVSEHVKSELLPETKASFPDNPEMKKILILFLSFAFTSAAADAFAEESRGKTELHQGVLKYVLKYGLRGQGGVERKRMARAGLCEKPETPSCEDFFGDADPSCFGDRTSCEINDLGKCKLWWQDSCKCDFIEWNRCGERSNTFCCIECRNDLASECSRRGGECRKTCARFHRAVNTSCSSPSCRCVVCTETYN
ncbi:uncharacterized protein LOC134767012 [Penaeus indicus]|uniref:uncharacterized protein LOC134767012 n=1 Tax=Penaeus indicus TaxID=29960 RepID=UPI00300D3294